MALALPFTIYTSFVRPEAAGRRIVAPAFNYTAVTCLQQLRVLAEQGTAI